MKAKKKWTLFSEHGRHLWIHGDIRNTGLVAKKVDLLREAGALVVVSMGHVEAVPIESVDFVGPKPKPASSGRVFETGPKDGEKMIISECPNVGGVIYGQRDWFTWAPKAEPVLRDLEEEEKDMGRIRIKMIRY